MQNSPLMLAIVAFGLLFGVPFALWALSAATNKMLRRVAARQKKQNL
jgi:hypothetical protein